MTELNQIYKCEICDNIVGVVHTGVGQLVCCNQDMQLMKENTIDASREKHVPVVEKTGIGFKVVVGDIAHPMEKAHCIEWIEISAGDEIYRRYLKLDDLPEAEFEIMADAVSARAYCNLHGLWKS